MTLEAGVKALATAIAVDVKAMEGGKVDKEPGKGLSEANFTDDEKAKLFGIASEATKNRADSANADKVHDHTVEQITGLGTAATKDVGTNTGDVMEVGTYGYGAQNPVDNNYDVNDLPAGQRLSWTGSFTEADAVALNLPALGGSSTAQRSWHVECIGRETTRLMQTATEVFGVGTTRGRTFTRVKHDAIWYPWREVPMANSDGKISTNWLKTDVSTDPLSVTDVVLTRGAHGIGDVGTHANFQIPTSLIYNSFWEGNCLTINSKESPYGSMLILQQNKLVYGTLNDTDGIWATEIITDQNQVVLGKTAETARAALELTGEWVDLRPYLKPPFYFQTTRATTNPYPRIRKLSCGRVELDGVVSVDENNPLIPIGGAFVNVPAPFRPQLTSAGVIFADTADPLFFGFCNWIVCGEVPYGGNGDHGDINLIGLHLPTPFTDGALSLNGIYWFT